MTGLSVMNINSMTMPMTKSGIRYLLFAAGFLLMALPANAEKKTFVVRNNGTVDATVPEAKVDSVTEGDTFFDQGALVMLDEKESGRPESIFPEQSKNLALSHFTWGAEFGSSIDMTAHNLSTFDLDVNLGFKNSFIKLAGVGAGIHRSIATGDNYIPVYAVLRTSFRRRPSLFFLNLQVGYSFNTISDSPIFGDFSSALGLGVNLSQSRRAKSYIILSAGTRHFNENHKSTINLDTRYIYLAKLVIGVHF